MSSEAHVAQLQDLLERVQQNRLRLAEARSRAAEKPAEIASPVDEVVAPALPPIAAAPILPAPIPPAPVLPAPTLLAPALPAPVVPAPALPPPVVPAPVLPAPAEPVFELQPVEPEAELEPLPDEPIMTTSEPFEEVVATRPLPLVTPGQAELDLVPRQFPGTVAASGPVAAVSGTRELQRSFALEAVLFRAWRLGRDGGSR